MYVDCHPYKLLTHQSKSCSQESECDSVCLFLNSASEPAWFFIIIYYLLKPLKTSYVAEFEGKLFYGVCTVGREPRV